MSVLCLWYSDASYPSKGFNSALRVISRRACRSRAVCCQDAEGLLSGYSRDLDGDT
jgi:hypothetical protein